MTAQGGRIRQLTEPIKQPARLLGAAVGHAAWWVRYQMGGSGREPAPGPEAERRFAYREPASPVRDP